MSGLNEQFTKLSTGLNLSEGSNPSRSADKFKDPLRVF